MYSKETCVQIISKHFEIWQMFTKDNHFPFRILAKAPVFQVRVSEIYCI